MSTKEEMLKIHFEKMTELKNVLIKAQAEWTAYNKAFNQWMQAELGLTEETASNIHLSEILTKWSEKK